jgi:hypothetical protein
MKGSIDWYTEFWTRKKGGAVEPLPFTPKENEGEMESHLRGYRELKN